MKAWTRLVLALPAGLALVLLDYMLVAGMFLYQPAGGEQFIAVLLFCALAAVIFRRRWLVVAAQSMVTGLAMLRTMQVESPVATEEGFQMVGTLALGHVLAWLLARAFPRRPSLL